MRRLLTPLTAVLLATPAPADPPTVVPTAAKAFAVKVQPILANACADCHARKTYPGPFKLRPTDADDPDRAATDANLLAVAAHLDPSAPLSSPVLKFATTAHGKGSEPPLKAGSPATANLALWVVAACGPAPAPAPVVQAGAKVPAPPPAEPAKLPPLKATPVQPFAEPKRGDPAKPNPADPFDPAGFNKK